MSGYRILVSGSRTWRDPSVIRRQLDDATHGVPAARITLVHGAAAGVDTVAARYATTRGWNVEAHHADWAAACRKDCARDHRRVNGRGEYCPAAGTYRNQAMVDTAPDLLLAFLKDHSAGASDCLRRAKKAGIPIRAVYDCGCHEPDGTFRMDDAEPLPFHLA